MQRIYKSLIVNHFKKCRQMFLLMGARQVGKTTLCKSLREEWENYYYFNWDEIDDRALIVEGAKSVGKSVGLDQIQETKTLIIFDELHKYEIWKDFLKGFFDAYEKKVDIVVTGSARLDAFRGVVA